MNSWKTYVERIAYHLPRAVHLFTTTKELATIYLVSKGDFTTVLVILTLPQWLATIFAVEIVKDYAKQVIRAASRRKQP